MSTMEKQKYEHETTDHEYITVKLPVETYNRICNLLSNMVKINSGIVSVFSRWKINNEPLRHDAKSIYDELIWMESRKRIIKESRMVKITSATRKG